MATKTLITLTAEQIRDLENLVCESDDTTEISIGTDTDTGEGYFAWFTDNPQEGAFNL